MDYLIVVDARCHPVEPGVVATESAFAAHLRLLRTRLGPRFDRLVLAAPSMSRSEFEANRAHLGSLSEKDDGIVYLPLFSDDDRIIDYWFKDARRILPALWRAVRSASIVHSGLAYDLYRPSTFIAILFAILLRRRSIFFIDIDFRNKAKMHLHNGTWSYKSYFVCRYLFDPLRRLQVWIAARACSLCLLKSAQLVADYGRGRPNVRNFLDTAHSESHIIPPDAFERKMAFLRDPDVPLKIVFFGRFVRYKGLDQLLWAVHRAREKSGRPFEVLLIGSGDQRPAIEALRRDLGAEDWCDLREPISFGPALFDVLRECTLHVATPMLEDTPRAAFDAMAAGLPVVAFDIAYYRDLRETGAVETVPWPDKEALANRLVALDQDRPRLERMARRAVVAATANTQEIWLDRRVAWTLELLDGETEPAHAALRDRS
ncbi:MAG TPA: glycosyltransferase [Deltaproteobacteria bacterium]|nr:glycosyltransferase [Deltaproteobacteria bacterium]